MQPHITIEGFGPAAVPTIYGIGRNYREHARELGNPIPEGAPVVFLKAPASLRSLTQGQMAFANESFHHEAELVLRIGQTVPVGTVTSGWQAVDAIGLGLDLTRRETQATLKAQGLPWTLAKSFSGSSVVSPLLKLSDCEGQTVFNFKFFLNDELKQIGTTADMIFDVPFLIRFLASFNTLLPGDLIFTGTPAGVGPMKLGDAFTLELDKPHRKWSGTL
jgi:acylpyruvate hydrolase